MTTIYTTNIPAGATLFIKAEWSYSGQGEYLYGTLLYASSVETGPIKVALFTGDDVSDRFAQAKALKKQIETGEIATTEETEENAEADRASIAKIAAETAEIEADGGIVAHLLKTGRVVDSSALEDSLDDYLNQTSTH